MSLYVDLTLGEKQLFMVNEYAYSGKDFPLHFHPELELTYVFRSSGLRIVGDSIESYTKDDLVVVGSNIPHQWQKDERFKIQNGDTEHIIVVHINESLLKEYVEGSQELSELKPLLEDISSSVRFDKKTAKKVKPLLKSLVHKSGIESFTCFFEILRALQEDTSRRQLVHQEFRIPTDLIGKQQILTIVKFMLNHYQKPIKASDLAKEINLSPSAFSHYFKKRTAKTFKQYLNDIRLGRACTQLRQTENSIVEICFDSGFNNLSNFNRSFKRKYKMTPKQYREHYKIYLFPSGS
jgi:AraC-like DNA-binding protein